MRAAAAVVRVAVGRCLAFKVATESETPEFSARLLCGYEARNQSFQVGVASTSASGA